MRNRSLYLRQFAALILVLAFAWTSYAAVVLPVQGEAILLQRFLSVATTLRLFTNDYTPVETTTEANVTEMSGYGYSAISLSSGSWSYQTTTSPAEASYAQQTFTLTSGPVSAYGYYVTQDSDGKLLWAERFTDGPYSIPAAGGTVRVTAKFTAD
ncbi:MAG: hypothetical protein ABFD89_00790 [Bryobacteraceae bacterium]